MFIFPSYRFGRRFAASFGVACAAFGATANNNTARSTTYMPQPFEHYQLILDRMPFGALPANFNAAASNVDTSKNDAQIKAEQQAIAKKINMSAVNVTPEGSTAIGFTDLSVNPPVSYYLRVGESSGGWTVLSADFDTEIAAIEKDGVTISLKLGQGLVDAPPPSRTAGTAAGQPPASSGPAGKLTPPPFGPPGLIRIRKPDAPTAVASAAEKEAAETRSYVERLRARTSLKTKEQMAADAKRQEQIVKLARDAAASEFQRREKEKALAAQELEDFGGQQQGQSMTPQPDDPPPEEPQ